MAPKKPAEFRKRKRELILLEVKQDIIRKHEQGMRLKDLAREYGRRTSTIGTILRDKEKIMGRKASKGATVIAKNRPPIIEEVEKLLLLWMHEKERAGEAVTSTVVCAKARALHADLTAQQPGTLHTEFKASKGWFERFKARSGIHSVVRHREAASSDLAESSAEEQAMVEEIISLGETMALEVSTQDIEELVEGNNLELSTEDLLSLQEQQRVQPDTSVEQEKEPRQLPSSSYKKACELWRQLQIFVNDLSEDQAAAQKAVENFDDVVVAPWRAMLRKRQRQQTMDWFLVKQARQEEEPCCSSQLSPSASSSQK